MRGDLNGKLVPREALNGPIPGAVAQISGHQIVPGHMGTTGSTYRFEFNTDPTILARVWDGTNTSWFMDSLGLVTMRNQLVMETGLGSAGTQASLESTTLEFFLVETDSYPTVTLSNLDIEFGAGGATAPDINLYRHAANVLKTDDQFRAIDGVQTIYISGAGKVAAADGDFTATPANGMTAVVFNTTDSTTRFSVRANGTWHTTAAI